MSKKLKIIIHFDDAKESILYTITNYLCINKVPFTVFIPTFFIGRKFAGTNTKVMSLQKIMEISKFAEFGFHSHTHRNFNYISKIQIYHEFKKGLKIIKKMRINLLDAFAFPGGTYNFENLNISKNYFNYIFSASDSEIEYIDKNYSVFPRYSPKNKDYNYLIENIDKNKENDSYLILVFHDIVDNVINQANDFSKNNFINLILFLKQNKYKIVSTSQLIEEITPIENIHVLSTRINDMGPDLLYFFKRLINLNLFANILFKNVKFIMTNRYRPK